MPLRSALLSLLVTLGFAMSAPGDEALPLVFEDDFSRGADRWEPTDPAAWTLGKDGDRAVWGLNKRTSAYQPKVRSPHNVASGRITVYFDDLETPLMEATDTTFTGGRVGIGSFDDMNDFTDVKVRGRKAEADGK